MQKPRNDNIYARFICLEVENICLVFDKLPDFKRNRINSNELLEMYAVI